LWVNGVPKIGGFEGGISGKDDDMKQERTTTTVGGRGWSKRSSEGDE